MDPLEATKTLSIEQKDLLEEAYYRSIPWVKLDLIQSLSRPPADPFAMAQAIAPIIIQSTPAQPGNEVTARFLEPVADPTLEWAANVGKVTGEKMRGHEGTPKFSLRGIPCSMFRAGRRAENVYEKGAHEGINYGPIVLRQKVAQFGMAVGIHSLFTVKYGYSPNILRAQPEKYEPQAHPHVFWGGRFASSYDGLSENPLDDVPAKDLPAKIAYKCKELGIQKVRIGGKVLNAVAFVDYDTFHAVYEAQLDKVQIIKTAAGSQYADYEVEDWAKVRFIDHGMPPEAPVDVTSLSAVEGGSGDDTYYTLDFDNQEKIAVPQEIGGADAYNTIYVLGGGAVRQNDGSVLYDESDDPYRKYDMELASWMGRVYGQARGDRYLVGSSAPINKSSFILHLRRMLPLAA